MELDFSFNIAGASQWDETTRRRMSEMRTSVKWIQGPENAECSREDFVILACIRNAELWINSFLEHHDKLKPKHYFFLDNDSQDATLAFLKSRDDVTVFNCRLPFDRYYSAFYLFLLWNFGRDKWSLFVDQDTRFDYPGSKVLFMKDFLIYLNQNGFNAVRTHIMDMFSTESLCDLNSQATDDLRKKYQYCDVSDLWAIPDPNGETNFGPGRDFPYLIGGIRKTVFGNEKIYLTAHMLTFDGAKVSHPNGHDVVNAHLADVTAMVWHYKFLGNFVAYQKDFLNRWQADLDSPCTRAIFRETASYVKVLSGNPRLSIAAGRPLVKPTSVDDFFHAGILRASEKFNDLVAEKAGDRGVTR